GGGGGGADRSGSVVAAAAAGVGVAGGSSRTSDSGYSRSNGGGGGVTRSSSHVVAGSRSSSSSSDGGGGGGFEARRGGVRVDGQESHLVTVKNLRPRRRVVIAVVNVSSYFSVTPVATVSSSSISADQEQEREQADATGSAVFLGRGGGAGAGGTGGAALGFRGWGQGLGVAGGAGGIELFDVPAGESLTLRVTPRLDKLRSGAGLALLTNEQSLEEHFMVYNRRHPTEQYRISLKLTSGALRTFFLSPGSKNAYPFWTLEDKITSFLQAYQWMWREFLDLEPQLNSMLSEKERGGAAFKESGFLVFQRALEKLDAAMIAAGEPRSTVGGSYASSAAVAAKRTASPSGGGGGVGAVSSGGGDGSGRSIDNITALSSSSSFSSSATSPAAAAAAASSRSAGATEALLAVAQQCSRLIFEMFYITDELLYYALKHEGFVGEFALRLANLAYSVVFRHEVFVAFAALPQRGRDSQDGGGGGGGEEGNEAPVFLRRWGAHVNHFLGYFPYPQAKPVILPLVELRRSLAPCFAALPAGDNGRAREGAPTRDDVPSLTDISTGAAGG
ncbi:unnamed protein product, partial [Pylaiella littoralis]